MVGCKSKDQARKIAESVKKHWDSVKDSEYYKERCENMSKSDRGRPSYWKGKSNPNMIGNINGFKKGHIPWNKGMSMTKETKEKMINSLQKSLHKKPNKQEQKLIKLFQYNNLPYKFVGDFSFWIGGKNPDFININGEKKIIEFAGRYWHDEKEMQDRINIFASYGFKTKIIWDDEFNINQNKIIEELKKW